jgi:hypothetical protein
MAAEEGERTPGLLKQAAKLETNSPQIHGKIEKT